MAITYRVAHDLAHTTNSRPSLSAVHPIHASSHHCPPATPLSFVATQNPSAQTATGDITHKVVSEEESQWE